MFAALEEKHFVYTRDNFWNPFTKDLKKAKGLILIRCPYVHPNRIARLMPLLKYCSVRGVRICMFVMPFRLPRNPTDYDLMRLETFNTTLDSLRAVGVHITYHTEFHEKVAIMDETVLWDGSVNFLSFDEKSERTTRWESRIKGPQAIEMHHMHCATCKERGYIPSLESAESAVERQKQLMGNKIKSRRRLLQMSQEELSELSKVPQTVISRMESGRRDLGIEVYVQLGKSLGLEVRYVETYLTLRVDDALSTNS